MLTSYMMLNLVNGVVEARVGAALPTEILGLAPPCSLTFLVRESESVEFRMSCSSVEFADGGIVQTVRNQSELVGAWPRVLPIALRASESLAELQLSGGDVIEDWWFRPVQQDLWWKTSRQDALESLDESATSPGDAMIVARGPRNDVDQLFAAIARERQASDELMSASGP